jgi:hypothetical protein
LVASVAIDPVPVVTGFVVWLHDAIAACTRPALDLEQITVRIAKRVENFHVETLPCALEAFARVPKGHFH